MDRLARRTTAGPLAPPPALAWNIPVAFNADTPLPPWTCLLPGIHYQDVQNVHNLDFLRSCAVMFVLFDHTAKSVGFDSIAYLSMSWLGGLGVLFFFVHTACVLMMSLERHRGESLVTHFYVRRIFRIYPLAIVAVLASCLTGIMHLKPWEWGVNLFLVQNLTTAKDALGVLWSLPLEVQMYIFLPFFFLVVRRLKSSRQLLPVLLALWCGSVGLALLQPHLNWRAGLLKFVPCFLPGVIAYALFLKKITRFPAWLLPVTLGTLVVGFDLHPGWRWSAWLACLVLGLSLPLFRQISNARINTVTLNIAKYSYGIYLSHDLLRNWMKPTLWTVPLYLLAVALVSVAAYHLIEKPMIDLANRLLRPIAPRQLAEENFA